MTPTRKKTATKKTAARKKGATRKAPPKKKAARKSAQPVRKAAAPPKKKAAAPKKAAPKKAAPKSEKPEKAEKSEKVAKKASVKASSKAGSKQASPEQPKVKVAGRPPTQTEASTSDAADARKRPRTRQKNFTPPGPQHPKLGYKYVCFHCGAKFYDLNKPDPVCPKCGEDQRDRPAEAPPPPSPPKRPAVRPMAPLLEEEEDSGSGDDEFDVLGRMPSGSVGEDMFDEMEDDEEIDLADDSISPDDIDI